MCASVHSGAREPITRESPDAIEVCAARRGSRVEELLGARGEAGDLEGRGFRSDGDAGTVWNYSGWYRFGDWFEEQLADALIDSAMISVQDDDGIVSVTLVATNGVTANSYPCRRVAPESNDWMVPPPVTEMVPGSEILYYFEAQDGVGSTSAFPADAPDTQYEFSILPIHGSLSDPGTLLVDKHGRRIPGERRDYSLASQAFYEEALDILGYEYDVYDVRVPSGNTDQSNGPDSVGYKYYDTQIWFASGSNEFMLKVFDQLNLIAWLGQSSEGKERNLLLTGNNLGAVLVVDSLDFASEWLGSDYCESTVGDTIPGLRDVPGDLDFMTFDDAECVLRGGWPDLPGFDVIQPYYLAVGVEVVAEYVRDDMSTRPAGVAFTGEFGHQAVALGFGIEFMSDSPLPNGYFSSGASDRVDLMANIMEYFGKSQTATPTGAEEGGVLANRLGHAHPNPFNPLTTIGYSLAGRSSVTIRVYDLAGRVVRTLVDGETEPGEHKVVWDGTTAAGQRAASGVYFVRMEGTDEAGSFSLVGKAVMLK